MTVRGGFGEGFEGNVPSRIVAIDITGTYHIVLLFDRGCDRRSPFAVLFDCAVRLTNMH